MRRSLLFCGALLASLCAWAEPAQVRLLSSDFVLPGKHQRLAGWAREAGVELRGLRLGIGVAAAVLLALFAAGAVRQSVVNRRPMENRS
ncbi:hypothetical protein Z046_16585 [Pseudomonas aeruginosa VRFPA09]|nr:hypothetical protein Z046_16585 [Pseudomonas aeruginosa VRFPA09]